MAGYAGLVQSVISALGVVGGVGSSLWATNQAAGASNRARDWQKMMADSAYQRTVQDMRIAGLNPMMLAGGAHPGIAPGSNAAQVFQPDVESAADSARGALRAVDELRELGARADKAEADAKTAKEYAKVAPQMADSAMQDAAHSADLRARQASLTTAQDSLAKQQAKVQEIVEALERTRIPAARAQMRLDESKFGETLRKWNRIVRSTLGEDQTSAR